MFGQLTLSKPGALFGRSASTSSRKRLFSLSCLNSFHGTTGRLPTRLRADQEGRYPPTKGRPSPRQRHFFAQQGLEAAGVGPASINGLPAVQGRFQVQLQDYRIGGMAPLSPSVTIPTARWRLLPTRCSSAMHQSSSGPSAALPGSRIPRLWQRNPIVFPSYESAGQ